MTEAHWKEVGPYPDKLVFKPRWDFYEAAYSQDKLGIYTVRQDVKLVGYLVILADFHPHHNDSVFATADGLYIDPAYRGGRVAWRLMKFAEQDLKRRGAKVLTIASPSCLPIDRGLSSLGFDKLETVYSKYIGD